MDVWSSISFIIHLEIFLCIDRPFYLRQQAVYVACSINKQVYIRLEFLVVVSGNDDVVNLHWVSNSHLRMMSDNTLRTMRHSWVASSSCWRFPIRGSIAKCSLISAGPLVDVIKRRRGYHTVVTSQHAVNTQPGVVLPDLA